MPVGSIPQYFWIDDGSQLWDGTWCYGNRRAIGVKVRVPDGYTGQIVEGRYYVVTGIMRTGSSPDGVHCVRWLWPRDAADIVLVPELPSQ